MCVLRCRPRLADLFERPEHYDVVANDYRIVREAVSAAIA